MELQSKYPIWTCARAHNKHVNALVTLASKRNFPDETIDMRIMTKTLRGTIIDPILIGLIEEQIDVVPSFKA